LDIPENRTFDAALCSEVLEHVPDAVAAIQKIGKLVKPGGLLILTAPFVSLTHFAPYHYATGFSRYWYEHHLPRSGFKIVSIESNGGFFDLLYQETTRSQNVYRRYVGEPNLLDRVLLKFTRMIIDRWSRQDKLSSEFCTFG